MGPLPTRMPLTTFQLPGCLGCVFQPNRFLPLNSGTKTFSFGGRLGAVGGGVPAVFGGAGGAPAGPGTFPMGRAGGLDTDLGPDDRFAIFLAASDGLSTALAS